MEYFISNNKSPKKTEVVKNIENSYMRFMKFKDEDFVRLKKEFNIINASFIYYYKFK